MINFSYLENIPKAPRTQLQEMREEIAHLRAELEQAHADLAKIRLIIHEHLPLHEIDEYGFHSPACDTCALEAICK